MESIRDTENFDSECLQLLSRVSTVIVQLFNIILFVIIITRLFFKIGIECFFMLILKVFHMFVFESINFFLRDNSFFNELPGILTPNRLHLRDLLVHEWLSKIRKILFIMPTSSIPYYVYINIFREFGAELYCKF